MDGTVVDADTAKQIVKARFKVSSELRAARRQTTRAKRQKERHLDGVRSKAKPSPTAEMALAKDAIPAAKSA